MKRFITCHGRGNLIKPRGKHMSGKPTILLIDDDRGILEGACLRLRACGYDTVDAHDGIQGIATAIKTPPDAIVMDVRMPRMDGLAALSELQENTATKDIPVVMLSASLIDQQRALDAGARFFLTKPYAWKDLVGAIASALDECRRPAPSSKLGNEHSAPNCKSFPVGIGH